MSDWTMDDSMAKIIYEVSDREIYNDVRAEIGIAHSETVVDADPTYSWKYFSKRVPLGLDFCTMITFKADASNALYWNILADHYAFLDNYDPYYDYSIVIDESDEEKCVVKSCNTGMGTGDLWYRVRYKYRTSEQMTHEETVWETVTVRATDADSIAKYGRRVMNLTWPQGATKSEMKMIADAALLRYKEPVPVVHATLQGKTDTVATQIFTREISDTISVVCANLGMSSTDFYIDSISIHDNAKKVPVCNWLLTQQRTEESTGFFTIDTDSIDGSKLIA